MMSRIINVGSEPLAEGHVEQLTALYHALANTIETIAPGRALSRPVVDAVVNLTVHMLICGYGPENAQTMLHRIADAIDSLAIMECVGTA